uniref:DNA-directed DNA polymerase n=1 Tax=Tanacetum cinerariifolium TaxID=118510 RepID=A0A6L2L8X3_TANCI|nr:DNA-directed DNA polymerase [Tanacetum cinerariifolium]
MADQRTMTELLQAPTKGYEDAIVVPAFLVENFELNMFLVVVALTDAVKDLLHQNKTPTPASIKAVEDSCVTCGGPHPYYNCTVTDGNAFKDNIQEYVSAAAMNINSSLGLGLLPSNTVGNPRGDSKEITTRSGVSNDGPPILPPFASTFKSLLSNKEKLFELANTPLNENFSPILLKKLPKKLGDPGKFLIPCDFLKLDECLALADLDASINLMPLFVWKKLSLPELTSTRMTLELANRSAIIPKGIAEDVFVKVGKFYFLANFIVVDYEVDPRVPVILGRPFLRTARALIDVHGEEMTLRVNDESITFKVRHTSRYSRNYYDEMVHQVNVIDVACEEYAQKVLRFLDSSTSGNPTPSDPIIASFSLSFTPFEGSDFIVEEIETFLRTPDELFNLDDDYYDTKGDILYLEKLLNENPSPNLPLVKNEDLKQVDDTMTKLSIEEPSKLELKDLPSHLEYTFSEWTDKLPVIISKELKDEEKSTLLKVIKLHKRAITWKISDIKGIDPRFCTHKILMEDDFKPAVQHQRRVNPKMHEVIKKEVIKLVDAGLIYLISDSPWVIPIHCVPEKGGMTVVTNEDNELIPTRTFSYRRMPFDLCNAPGTFQRYMVAIFHDMIEEMMEVFMDDFSVFGDSFSLCLSHLDKMLKRCEDTNLVLNWEKCHFMVKEDIVLGHTISKYRIKVDRAKVDVIAKLPHPTSVKENLTADHLSRLENPHQGDLEKKEINETFPLETLGMVEEKAIPTNDARVVVKFLKSLFARFGTPCAIISHGENCASWSDKLNDALWAFHTTFKTPIGCTPYMLVYEKACHLPIELEHKAYWALKHSNFDLKTAGDHQKVQLNEFYELRDQAYENSLIYKEKTKKVHDSKIKNRVFNIGDRVLLFNSRLKIFSRKLKAHWTGPFTVAQVFPYETIELSQTDGLNIKVNGHKLKHYFGGDIPHMVVPNLQTFPMDY